MQSKCGQFLAYPESLLLINVRVQMYILLLCDTCYSGKLTACNMACYRCLKGLLL